MTYETVQLEISDEVGLVRLNRPEARNAINSVMLKEVSAALTRLDQDDQVGVVVVTGDEKAFAAGMDIREMRDFSFVDVFRSEFIAADWRGIDQCRKPVIAAVAGYALGGGCELALACDVIIAADTAKFGLPEINLGIIPGAGGTQRLTRLIGKSKAMEMILTGRTMNAEEAERAGLVSRVVAADRLMEEAMRVAGKIAEKSRVATMAAKDAVARAQETSLGEGLLYERRLFQSLFATEDQAEGMSAFLERRSPQFRNR